MAAADDAKKIASWLKANAQLRGTPQYDKAARALKAAHTAATSEGGVTSLDMSQNARLATPQESMQGARMQDRSLEARFGAMDRSLTGAIADIDRRTQETMGERAGGAGVSALQGLSFNLADEIGGGLAAAGTYATTGDAERAGRAYSDVRDTLRDTEEAYVNRHPTEAFAANMAGGLVTGLASAPRSLLAGTGSFGARMGRAAATGGVYGGLAGAGAGEDGLAPRIVSGGIGATAGAGLGPVAETLGSILIRSVRGMGRSGPLLDPNTGQVTQAGVALIQRAGLDPAQVPPAMLARLEEIRNRTPLALDSNPEAAASIAMGESLPVPVRMTRGQATQDPAILSDEYRMARAGYDGPGRIMREARGAQEDALRENIPAIQAGLGGPPIERGEGGAAAANRLVGMRDTAKAQADALYDTARTVGAGVSMDGRVGVGTAQRIATRLTADHAVEGIPRVQREVDRLAAAGEAGDVPIRVLFETRTRLNSIRANGGEEAVAARKAVTELDAALDDALRLSLLRGDQAGVDAWRTAIANYRDYKDTWGRRDLINELTSRDPQRGWQLKRPPEEAANYILGASDLGLINKRNMASDLARLRDILGETSPEWNGIRQEVFLRVAQRAEGAQSSDGRAFSGAKMATAWEDLNRKSPEVVRMLFTAEERRDIGNFVNVARRVTTLNRDAANPSGTAYAMERLMRASSGLVEKFPVFGRAFAFIANKAKEGGEIIKANRNVREPLPGAVIGGGASTPLALSAASSGFAGVQNQRQSRQRP